MFPQMPKGDSQRVGPSSVHAVSQAAESTVDTEPQRRLVRKDDATCQGREVRLGGGDIQGRAASQPGGRQGG